MAFADIRINADVMREQNHDAFTRLFNGAIVSADATVTTSTTSFLDAGMTISGLGIPDGATVASVTSATVFELSANATKTGNITMMVNLYDDEALQELKYTAAIERIKQDLQTDLNIADEDLADALITIAANYENAIKAALLNCQCMYYYFELAKDKESKEYQRFAYYEKQYARLRGQFKKFILRESLSINTLGISRG